MGMKRTRTILALLLISAALGGIGGVGGRVGLPPAIIWAVFAPIVFFFLLPMFTRRRKAAGETDSKVEAVLLDASNTGGRIIQTVLPLMGTLLSAVGVAMMFRANGGVTASSVSLTVVGIVVIALSMRHVVGWDVSYKGHTVRFENDPCSGEHLYIDGQLVDRGGVGYQFVLSGRIPSGEVIRATSRAGIPFHCRIEVIR